MDIFNNWVEEGARETGSWSWEEDLLKAMGGDPGLHHQPTVEEDDTDMLNTPDMLTEEFVAPPEVEAEWDLHSELVGMKDPHPSEEELFRGYNYKLVSPTEVEGRASISSTTDLHHFRTQSPPPQPPLITTSLKLRRILSPLPPSCLNHSAQRTWTWTLEQMKAMEKL